MYDYYVYAYLREKDNTPYYIGKGKCRRAYTNISHYVNLPKDKSRIIFYQIGLTENDAFKLEIAYIKLFGRKDLNTGILRNLTNGGEGASGYKHTPETKQKLITILINSSRSRAEEGNHNFQGDRNPSHERIARGDHNLQGKNNPIHKRVASGEHQILTSKIQNDLVFNGNHHWLKKMVELK
jgi:hypothetical protein